ncbi:hypothetical protein [Reyranella soli]|nr:hypothetical protein [Reyranella soli]
MSDKPAVPPGAKGNFNLGPGTTYQYYYDYGPQKLTFTPEVAKDILANISKGKITVEGVGSDADFSVAMQIAEFLKQNGYEVILNRIGMRVPPPSHKLNWDSQQRVNCRAECALALFFSFLAAFFSCGGVSSVCPPASARPVIDRLWGDTR